MHIAPGSSGSVYPISYTVQMLLEKVDFAKNMKGAFGIA